MPLNRYLLTTIYAGRIHPQVIFLSGSSSKDSRMIQHLGKDSNGKSLDETKGKSRKDVQDFDEPDLYQLKLLTNL